MQIMLLIYNCGGCAKKDAVRFVRPGESGVDPEEGNISRFGIGGKAAGLAVSSSVDILSRVNSENVCWYLYEKSSEGSQRSVANGMLPYSYVGRDENVRHYIKIYDEDRFNTKYNVSLTHSGPLTKKRREISLEFNSFGDLLVAKNHKCFHFSRVKT